MITLYGSAKTNAGRCIWLLEELNVPYEHKELDAHEQQSAWFLKLNPNGEVPVLLDDEWVLSESYAINQYLAEKYKSELLGRTTHERAEVSQWTWWVAAHVQTYFEDIMFFLMYERGTEEDAIRSGEEVKKFLHILDQHVSEQDFIVGQDFSLADINVASVINIGFGLEYDFSEYPAIIAWINRMKTRPAMISLLAKMDR